MDAMVTDKPKVDIKDLSFYYGSFKGLKNVSVPLMDRKVTAFIGPSGCGKSTLLRILNRIYELYPNQRAEGQVLFCNARPRPDPPTAPRSISRADPFARKTVDAQVFRLQKLADDVMLVHLRFPAGIRVKFKAGQHLNLILDNGADLIEGVLARGGLTGLVGATEETTTGGLRIRSWDTQPDFPVIVINDSRLKLLVENEFGVGQSVVST